MVLILLIIPVVALVIDRIFFFVQAELFPYRYGGSGILNSLVRAVLHAWEDIDWPRRRVLKRLVGQRPPASPIEPHTP